MVKYCCDICGEAAPDYAKSVDLKIDSKHHVVFRLKTFYVDSSNSTIDSRPADLCLSCAKKGIEKLLASYSDSNDSMESQGRG